MPFSSPPAFFLVHTQRHVPWILFNIHVWLSNCQAASAAVYVLDKTVVHLRLRHKASIFSIDLHALLIECCEINDSTEKDYIIFRKQNCSLSPSKKNWTNPLILALFGYTL